MGRRRWPKSKRGTIEDLEVKTDFRKIYKAKLTANHNDERPGTPELTTRTNNDNDEGDYCGWWGRLVSLFSVRDAASSILLLF